MKRAPLGKKSKSATPARKPAAKRPPARPKSKPAKPATKKRSPIKKTKTPVAKKKITKAKNVPAKIAAPKTTKLKRPVVAKRKTAKPVVVQKKATPVVARHKKTAPKIAPSKPRPVLKVVQKAVRKITRKKVAHKPQFTVPAFLLEGDEPSHPAASSFGEKFALGPTPPLDHFDEAKAPLPESYGTGRLFLTARDPHWLYAHWDFTMQEQFRYNAQSADRHMVLRLHDTEQPGAHISEVHVHPESRHWFTHVEDAGGKYFTEIGYYQAGRKWKSLATSEPQRTPPDNISADSTIEFATIPLELSFETMLALLKEHSADDTTKTLPLARAIENIRNVTRHDSPAAEWTPEQEAALAEILAAGRTGLALPSSQDSAREEIAPSEVAPFDESPSSYVSSFFGGEGQKNFWFNVNAELIIYGATEPNATVTFAGKQIPLRADGSFRFRFALPDGQYELPVTAVSADGTDGRAAELKFTRATEIRGHVLATPTDPALNPPPQSS